MMKMLGAFRAKGFILIQVLLCLMVLSWLAMAIFEQTAEMVKACDRLWWHDQQHLKP
jgi:Tfp pilus assembly protein PilX